MTTTIDATTALAQFAHVGYHRIDGFTGPHVGRAMLDDVLRVVRANDGGASNDAVVMPEARLSGGDIPPEQATSKVFRLHRRPAFTSFLRDPRVAEIVTMHLGPDVDCFLSQFIFKNPGALGQPWHQDSRYFPFEPARPIIALWLAVTEATLENGCLQIVPASHLEPVHEHVPDPRPGANRGYIEIVDHDMSKAEPVLMQAGDLLVFDSHLMHRSADNNSVGIRAAMVFHFARSGTVDLSGPERGGPSPITDWMPLLRAGELVID